MKKKKKKNETSAVRNNNNAYSVSMTEWQTRERRYSTAQMSTVQQYRPWSVQKQIREHRKTRITPQYHNADDRRVVRSDENLAVFFFFFW